MAEHTPGPWDTGSDEHNICAERDGRRVIVAMTSHDITGDTLSGPSGCGNEHRECHANARLIAAAPELLEALEDINDALMVDGDCPAGCGGSNEHGHSENCPILTVRAAIFKAKGETR